MQPRGLVALFTALGLFHAVWRDMEILLKNFDMEEDNKTNLKNNNDNDNNDDYNHNDNNNNHNDNNNNDNNNNNNNNNKSNDENANVDNIENANVKIISSPVNEERVFSQARKNVPCLSLSHSFGIALERSSTELSEAEIFQVILKSI